MPTEIALVDGTKFQIAEDVRAAMELIGYPNPGWIYINEGVGTPARHFNPASIAYVTRLRMRTGMIRLWRFLR